VTAKVLDRKLPLPKGVALWSTENMRIAPPDALIEHVNVLHLNTERMGNLTGTRRSKHGLICPLWRLTNSWSCQKNGALTNGELCSREAVLWPIPETFDKAESPAQPIKCHSHIFVNKDRDNWPKWC